MGVSKSERADRQAIKSIRKSLSDLERDCKIGIERHDAGYDIFYIITEEMMGNGDEVDLTATATDDAVLRSSKDASMDEDEDQ
jgi:hypothetical protein